jgi:hypothetical protein
VIGSAADSGTQREGGACSHDGQGRTQAEEAQSAGRG